MHKLIFFLFLFPKSPLQGISAHIRKQNCSKTAALRGLPEKAALFLGLRNSRATAMLAQPYITICLEAKVIEVLFNPLG